MAEAVQRPARTRPPRRSRPPQRMILGEAKARFDATANADIGFVERLVWFWSNHFCVSADKDAAMVGAYEREAIRPHVLGRFADMLQAVESHPAMLVYLDNVQSMGADSIAGINRDKGLNEDLARETLDCIRWAFAAAMAKPTSQILQRSSPVGPGSGPTIRRIGGEFVFMRRLHEPGDRTVLGSIMSKAGSIKAVPCSPIWRRHPATARTSARNSPGILSPTIRRRHWSTKLTKTFLTSDGDLRAVARTLITSDESWAAPRTKLEPPAEWIAAVIRLTAHRRRVRSAAS